MKVDKNRAKKVLEKAYNEAKDINFNVETEYKEFLEMAIYNGGRAYKYILVTALVAKSTCKKINMMSLQASADIDGAYDARTLSKDVIATFEYEYLEKVLGGSGEPLAGFPGRNSVISDISRPQRKVDREIVSMMCDIFPNMDNNDSYNALVYVMRLLILRCEELKSYKNIDLNNELSKDIKAIEQIYSYIGQVSQKSCRGESLVLLVAGLYDMYMNSISDNYEVVMHPVNQSGKSSKGVSDLDIYRNDSIIIANELKDKPFSKENVLNVIEAVQNSSCNKMLFIKGNKSKLKNYSEGVLEKEILELGIYFKFYTLNEFTDFILAITDNIDIRVFYLSLINNARNKKCKDETIDLIARVAKEHGWI